MPFRLFFSFLLAVGLIFIGCSRKGNEPLLATPDPSITSIELAAVTADVSDLKNVKVTFLVDSTLGAPISGLKLGNIVIKEGWNLRTGGISYDHLPGSTAIVFEPFDGASPEATGIPIKLEESASVPGQYELTFRPRSLKGYAVASTDSLVYQFTWITVVYGDVTGTLNIGFPTS